MALQFDTSKIIPATDYYIGDFVYEPQTIRVSGEKKRFDEVEKILIPGNALDLQGLTEKTEVVIDITEYLPEGLQLVEENGKNVVVTIRVEQGGTKTINIPVGSIMVINAPTGMQWNYGDAEEIVLRVAGNQEILDALSLSTKDVMINLVNYQTVGKHLVPVIVNLPEGASLIQSVEVAVNLEKE